jgi:hypothetical protein
MLGGPRDAGYARTLGTDGGSRMITLAGVEGMGHVVRLEKREAEAELCSRNEVETLRELAFGLEHIVGGPKATDAARGVRRIYPVRNETNIMRMFSVMKAIPFR